MEASLSAIARQAQTSKTEEYVKLLHHTLAQPSSSLASDLTSFVQAVSAESTGLIVSRQVLVELVAALASLPASDAKQQILQNVLDVLQPRAVTFEEQITQFKLMLADLLEAGEEWSQCAKVLMSIPLDSGHRTGTDEFKLQIYVRIVRLLLEDDDAVTAESYFNRATLLIHQTQDKTIQLGYKLSQCRILDSQRKFNEAGSKYHELSYVTELDEDERLQALAAAVTCAILGPAGPTRSRLLGTLYRDERTQNLEQHPILAATFLDHIIRPSLVQTFEASLQPHQLAKLPPVPKALTQKNQDEPGALPDAKRGPETVLDRAIMEHNLLSASRIYANITFAGLGALLSLVPSAAEAMARTMIQQGRLKASMDQVERCIMFDPAPREVEGAVSNVAKAAQPEDDDGVAAEEPVHQNELIRWDLDIRRTTQAVEDLALRSRLLMTATVGA